MKKFKKTGLVLLALIVWFLLLSSMVLFESGAEGASIQSISDALWFSIVTLTTVGYGDFFPVSPLGKIIGIVFIVLSVGFFSLVISILVSMIRNQALPKLELASKKAKKWYYFADVNSKTVALAEDIHKQEEDAMIIFEQLPDSANDYKDRCNEMDALCFATSPESLLKQKKGDAANLHVFYMGDNGYENYQKALNTHKNAPSVNIYCETEYRPETTIDQITCFDQYDCTARLFWQEYGIKPGKNSIVFIGFEKYGTKLFERAFLTNIYGSASTFAYHVFGDCEEFSVTHTSLNEMMELNLDTDDELNYYHKPWYYYKDVIREADLILLCEDDDGKNLENLQKIKKSFPVKGQIYVKSAISLDGIHTFGSDEQIYTTDQVIREQLMKTAKALHGLYVDSKKKKGQSAAEWDEIPEILRQSNIAAADHILTKVRILMAEMGGVAEKLTPEICKKAYDHYMSYPIEEREPYWRIEHTRWMRFFALYNFSYGPKNFDLKTHNNYLPFDELDYESKSYDDNEWMILKTYCEKFEIFE